MNDIKYEKGCLLSETYDSIRNMLGESIESLTIDRIVIGLFFIGVKLSNGIGGLCFTPVKMIPEAVCCPSSAKAMPDSGKIKGKRVSYFTEDMFSSNPLKKAIAIAVLNALSETSRQKGFYEDYEYIIKADPLDFIKIPKDTYTVVIGALIPYLKMLKKNGNPYGILELDPRTLKQEEMPYFIAPDKADEAISKADYLIITGTTLINDTLEGILSKMKPGAKAVVVGPTASLYPEAFFKRGVISLGGITVTEADGLMDIVAEAGSGYHFYGKYAEKTMVINKNKGEG